MNVVCEICSRDGLDPEGAIVLVNGYRHAPMCEPLEPGDYHPFEHWTFPVDGYECWYRDADHKYFSEVKPVTQGRGADKRIVAYSGVAAAELGSPSTIAKYADPGAESLMGFVLRVERGDLRGIEGDLLDAAGELGVNDDQPDYLILRDAKGVVGTMAHGVGEAILKGEEWPEVHPVAEGYVAGIVQFFNRLGDFETLNAEQGVYSRQYGYAGRFDGRIRLATGRTLLLDFKTSSYIGRAYHNQLCGYDLAAEECGVGASDAMRIVQVREDGTSTAWPCRGTREGFLHNLASYLDGKRMDTETRADWRAWRAAA